ncbi:hypothetical protein [Algoriphagus sp. Y33]|uniref:hypothetical protein n=1 Tax=Algoriphagus sp. Y33 TaxID=2772483 RepID=UPI00177BF82B|nr:hypothetical protein [Algoriphagus sp. Y33]
MKLNILNLLRGGVFSLAVVAAFAFTTPMNSSFYGTTDNGVTWYDVTNVEEGTNPDEYQCQNVSGQCLYSEADQGAPIMDATGRFLPGSGLIPIP